MSDIKHEGDVLPRVEEVAGEAATVSSRQEKDDTFECSWAYESFFFSSFLLQAHIQAVIAPQSTGL